jgi:hypothetical protein
MAADDGTGTLEASRKRRFEMPIVSPTDALILVLLVAVWFAGVAALLFFADKLSHIHHRH